MSNVAKGNRFEKEVKERLESQGFWVEQARPKRVGKRSIAHDFYECIDLIAIHPKKPMTYFIQCTTGAASPRRHKIDKVPWNYDAHNVQIWKKMKDGRIKTYMKLWGVWTHTIRGPLKVMPHLKRDRNHNALKTANK